MDKKKLIDRLNKESFRVKSIFLELPSYSYFHSVLNKSNEDINERFVGRKELIDKLKSFIYETTRSTGTYLVTGFRGMGKTSVVNKTLAELNPEPKFSNYVLLWVLLIPVIIVYDSIKKNADYFTGFSNFCEQWGFYVMEFIILFLVFLYLGYRNSRRHQAIKFHFRGPEKPAFEFRFKSLKASLKSLWGLISWYWKWLVSITKWRRNKFVKLFYRSYESQVNPKFEKHKYSFHSILRIVFIYYLVTRCLILLFHYINSEYAISGSKTNDSYLNYESYYLFWFITYALVIGFIYNDIRVFFVKHMKKKNWFKYELTSKLNARYLLITGLGSFFGFLLSFAIFLGIIYYDIAQLDAMVQAKDCLEDNCIREVSDTLLIRHMFYFLGPYIAVYFFLKYIMHKIFYTEDRQLEVNEKRKSNYHSTLLSFLNFFDLQHHLIVKINLGKDNLTEKDVLKYITNELSRKYSEWHFNFKDIKRAIHLLGLTIVLYLFVSIFNKFFLGDMFTNFLNQTFSVTTFLPSQALVGEDLESSEMDRIFFFGNTKSSPKTVDKYASQIQLLTSGDDKDSVIIGYRSLDIEQNKFVRENVKSAIKLDSAKSDTVGIEHMKEYEKPSFWDKSVWMMAKISNQLDFLFIKVWYSTRRTLTRNFETFDKGGSAHTFFNFVYPEVPRLSVLMLCLFVIAFGRYVPRKAILLKSHYYVIRSLRLLQRQIDASIEVEKSGMATQLNNSVFNYLKRATYKPLESKDITQRLIHILNEINAISPLFGKVKVIFVFDELDKINTHYNNAISNLENEFDMGINEGQYLARRKERISRILSSMKHFLNSAQAKFIFIAGREMYDAALAGISDRDSSLDSIFNDNKLYVNSFYKEGNIKVTDITKATEEYVCQFLIPSQYTRREKKAPSLELYSKYLMDVMDDQLLSPKEQVKIIESLKNFISYLTYRSNGCPQKIVKPHGTICHKGL